MIAIFGVGVDLEGFDVREMKSQLPSSQQSEKVQREHISVRNIGDARGNRKAGRFSR